MSSRLVALDKCPGVRPIGVGECLRRVMAKAVMIVAGRDVQQVCGSDQLCSGLESGIEAAIHALGDLFNEHKGNGWGVLLIDASNAFNSLNRKAALWNARHLWPRGCRFIFNCYKAWSTLVVNGSSTFLYSKEGVTQGDPLSLAFYAISVLPLIRALKDTKSWTQAWYADDASCASELHRLLRWFEGLMDLGPDFGYFPEPFKSYVVVDETDFAEANTLFGHLGVKVVTSHMQASWRTHRLEQRPSRIRGRKGCAVEGLCCQNCQCCTFTAARCICSLDKVLGLRVGLPATSGS